MKKCILDIELVHGPRPRESQRENREHSSRLHHWTESLVVVHNGTLSEPPKDPTRLVALQSTIGTPLDCPNPLAGHHIATRRTWHKVPSLVGEKCSILLLHRATPVWISQSLTNRRRDRRKPRLPLGGGEGPRPKNLGRLPGHHGMGVMRIPMDDRRVVHGRLHPRAPWGRRRWRRRRRRQRRCGRSR
jgi:hypothetical protein